MTQGPRTLDELLAAVPGLRRCRRINADWLRRLLDRRKGECTWCGSVVPKGSRTWCSADCVNAFSLRCSSDAQARHVAQRDGDKCGICGRVIAELEQEFRVAWERRREELGLARYGSWKAEKEFREQYGLGQRNWREVDHIIPVVEGGGLLGPENLRLLCGVCHRKETARLRKRLSKKHKGPK